MIYELNAVHENSYFYFIFQPKQHIMSFTKQQIKELTYQIIGAAIEVHKHIGPGLLESVYQKCLAKEFKIRGIAFTTEHPVNVIYKGEKIDTELRSDFIVEDTIVVELKAVKEMKPVFDAQILTYMTLLEKPKGVLINFL